MNCLNTACSLILALLPLGLQAQQSSFIMRYDMNQGEPRFTLGTDAIRTASISMGDVDGDGDVDAVVANGRHWPAANEVFFNQNGRYTSYHTLGDIHGTSYAAELADMDGDGDLDIIEGNDMAPHVLYLNDGKGHFSRHANIGTISSTRNVVLADLDNNGFSDVIICNRGHQNEICYNEGGLIFSCQQLDTDANATIDIEVADMNNDGLPDLILANRNNIPNALYLNSHDRKWIKATDFGSGTFETRSIEAADVDQDGFTDIITANINGKNAVYFGSEGLKLDRVLHFGNDEDDTYSVTAADFDKDGFIDFATGNYNTPGIVFMNRKGKGFEAITLFTQKYRTYDIKTADINADGWPDIVLANSDDVNFYMLNNLN